MPDSSNNPIDPRRHALDNERSEWREVQDHQDARLADLSRLQSDATAVPTDVEADLEQWRTETDPECRRPS